MPQQKNLEKIKNENDKEIPIYKIFTSQKKQETFDYLGITVIV